MIIIYCVATLASLWMIAIGIREYKVYRKSKRTDIDTLLLGTTLTTLIVFLMIIFAVVVHIYRYIG